MEANLRIEYYESYLGNQPAIKGVLMEGNTILTSFRARTEKEVEAYLTEFAKETRSPYKVQQLHLNI